MRCVYLIS